MIYAIGLFLVLTLIALAVIDLRELRLPDVLTLPLIVAGLGQAALLGLGLLAAGGAWCGWAGLPLIVLISSALALIALLFPSFKKIADSGEIPFGPFLALAIAIVWASAQSV